MKYRCVSMLVIEHVDFDSPIYEKLNALIRADKSPSVQKVS